MNALRPNTSRKSICLQLSRNSRRALKRWASATAISAAPRYMRLEVLKQLREKGMLDGNLEWTGAVSLDRSKRGEP